MIIGGSFAFKILQSIQMSNALSQSQKNEAKKYINKKRQSQKFKSHGPIVTHRGCSKSEFKKPTLIKELNSDEEMFLKAEYGNYGEDAFFVVQTEVYLVFGIADGVGRWSDEGIDPAIFSGSLVKHACRNSIKIIKAFDKNSNTDSKKYYNISALKVMQAAYDDLLRYDGYKVFGSSTACFGSYNCKTNVLNIANLGDSGIYVRASNKFELLTKQMQHSFNRPFQLSNLPLKQRKKYRKLDKPKDAVEYEIKGLKRYYLIVGSDGVWDNVDMQNMRTNMDYDAYNGKNCSNKKMTKRFANNLFDEVVFNSKWPFSFERLNDGKNPNIADHGHFYGAKKDDISIIIIMV